MQLIARYIAIAVIALAAKMGATLTEADVAGICGALALGLVGLALLVFDHYKHRIQVLKLLESVLGGGEEKTSGNGDGK